MGQAGAELVSLRAVLLKEFDIQTLYSVATETARTAVCTFEGISLYELPTTPPSLADCLTFSLSEGKVDEVVQSLLNGLKADRSTVRFTVSPAGERVWKGGRRSVLYSRMNSYLRTNWGSPFIVGFMVLLLGSALELSLGAPKIANGVAVYAFYCLVLGVALQIASYLKYGEDNPSPEGGAGSRHRPSVRFRPARRILIAVVVVTLLVVASVFAATGVLFPSSSPSGCRGARNDGTVFISSTQTVSVKICGESFVVRAGEGGGLTYPYHSGILSLSAPASLNGTEFKFWYAVLNGNPQPPVDNNSYDLSLPSGLSAQSSSIEMFYSAPTSASPPTAKTSASSSSRTGPASGALSTSTSSATSSSSGPVSTTLTSSSSSSSTSTTSSSSSSSSQAGCQGSDGQIFLSTNIDEAVPISVCGQVLQVRGGTGGGLNFGYHSGQVTLSAPLSVGETYFEYWYVVFPALHEKITSSSAILQIPGGLTADGAVIIAVYG